MAQQQLDKSKLQGPSIRLSTVATSTRQTAKTDFGTVMRNGLVRAGNVAVDGLKVAAPFVPGSAIVSAAVAGANIASTAGAPSYGSGAVSSGGASYGVGSAGLSSSGGVGTSVAGLSAGAGPSSSGAIAPGNYGGDGGLALPGRRPGLDTPLNQPASNFSGAYGGGGTTGTGSAASASTDAFAQMMGATRQMAEFQASFNLQYLQLQEKIQQDTRQFNLVSNIMKTKHDAAKNALNNVR